MGEFSCRLRRFLYQEFIPVTKSVAIISGIMFLLSFIPGLEFIFGLFGLNPADGFLRPWTLVTYPFIMYRDILSAIFAILWLWMVGGSLERSLGSQTYGLFLFLATLVTGAAMSLIGLIHLAGGFMVGGLWLPLLGLTWAWAELAPDQEVLFSFFIPVKARWLAWINAAIVFLSYFQMGRTFVGELLFGMASISGIATAYLFTGDGPFSRGFRYWVWKRNTSPRGLRDRTRSKPGRRRFRLIK